MAYPRGPKSLKASVGCCGSGDDSNSIQPKPKNKEKELPPVYTQWSDQHGTFFPAGATIPTIPPNIYEVISTLQGWALQPLKFPSDELVSLPGTPIKLILEQIDKFWKRIAKFKEIGFLHKRGILMYGAAGCGKTSIIRLLCDELIKLGGMVLFIKNISLAEQALKGIRMIEPDRPILVIFEDIEGFMNDDVDSSDARNLLALLDGETQIEHVVYLATTNKPERLEERIIRRPGRFDLVIGLKYPTKEARALYLKRILKEFVTPEKFDEIITKTRGLGLSHLRELVAAVYCLDLDLDETIERLRNNQKKKIRVSRSVEGEGEEGCGFTVNFYNGEDDDKAVKLDEPDLNDADAFTEGCGDPA